LYHYCNTRAIAFCQHSIYAAFLTYMQWTMVFFCVYLYVYVNEIKLVKYAHVIREKVKDINQYKTCSTIHAFHLTAISNILIGKSTE
jgi:hypothetical protein